MMSPMKDPEELRRKGPERVVLALLDTPGEPRDEADEDEMRALAETAGALVQDSVRQSLPHPDAGTYFGHGKLDQIKTALTATGSDLLLVGGSLTPSQQSRLEDLLRVRVVDRTELILDIFAQRARTAEGRLQVELAQLTFRLTRLRGLGKHLSRLGGGIGTRGPGETKLEQDRQAIFRKMRDIKRRLAGVRLHRATARHGRPYPQITLLGYTNAGKTSLLGRLAEDVPSGEDRLFATLDPLTRLVRLPSGMDVLISDTVGFIRHLPHTLVAAFRATLEEVLEADAWIFVLDLATGDTDRQEAAIRAVLSEIGAGDRPTLRIYHKADLHEGFLPPDGIPLSSRTGKGLPQLLEGIEDLMATARRPGRWMVPFGRGDVVDLVHRRGIVLEEHFEEAGTLLVARVDPVLRTLLDRAGTAMP